MMKLRTVALIVGIVMWMTAPAWGSTITYTFNNCSEITSALGSGGSCPGNLNTTQATYTASGTSITATGYQEGSSTTATNLYVKNDGGDENGLGIANESDYEIDISQFIQLNLANLADAGITSGTLEIGSVQSTEGYAVYTSSQVGTLGALELRGTLDDTGFAVSWGPNDPVLGITAIDPKNPNCSDCDYHSDVLLVSLSASTPNNPTPEPASLALMGTGLLALAFMFRKFRKLSLVKQQ